MTNNTSRPGQCLECFLARIIGVLTAHYHLLVSTYVCEGWLGFRRGLRSVHIHDSALPDLLWSYIAKRSLLCGHGIPSHNVTTQLQYPVGRVPGYATTVMGQILLLMRECSVCRLIHSKAHFIRVRSQSKFYVDPRNLQSALCMRLECLGLIEPNRHFVIPYLNVGTNLQGVLCLKPLEDI